MPGFECYSNGYEGWLAWKGCPDDDVACQTILNWLQDVVVAGFVEPSQSLSNSTKGNLGEFITYQMGKNFVFTSEEFADTATAWDPLSPSPRQAIDIVWLSLGDDETDDWIALQEVKTTGASSLSLANGLVTDYDKLFGENLRLTLQARLGALKNKLDEKGKGELSPRLTALGGPSPNHARGIRLLPTLIHDSMHSSYAKMMSVRRALTDRGWSPNAVECWSISLSDLDNRLSQLAKGQL